MEISTRKLFRHGAAATALLVTALMCAPAVVNAADAPESVERELSVKERQERQERFALQDIKLEMARGLLKEQKFQEANQLTQEVLTELASEKGSIAATRRASIGREAAELREKWAATLLDRARMALIDKRYGDAIALASDVQTIDSRQREEATKLITLCTNRMRANEHGATVTTEAANPELAKRDEDIHRLLREGNVLYQAGRYMDARSRAEQVFLRDPLNQEAITMLNNVYRQLYSHGIARHKLEADAVMAASTWQWIEPVFTVAPDHRLAAGIPRSVDSQGIYARMERIVFPSVNFEDADIMAVIRFLNSRSKQFDPEKEGVNISAVIDSRTLEQMKRVTMSFSRIPMSEVVRYVCQDVGLKFRVDKDGIFISTEVDELVKREFTIRGNLLAGVVSEGGAAGAEGGAAGGGGGATAGRIDTNVGTGGGGGTTEIDTKQFLDNAVAAARQSISDEMLKKFFNDRGVSFNEGTSISYNRRAGKLMVRNTPENLQRLDELIRQLDAIEQPLIQIEIKAVEIADVDMQELGFDWSMDALGTTGKSQQWSFQQGANRVGMLRHGDTLWDGKDTSVLRNFNIFPALFGSQHPFGSDLPLNINLSVYALSQNARTETLAAPKILVCNDHLAQVKLVKSYYFPTSWDDYDVTVSDSTSGVTIKAPVPEFPDKPNEEIGVAFDVTARVASDNRTINLKVHPKITQYLGKDEWPMKIEGYYLIDNGPQPATWPPGQPYTRYTKQPTETVYTIWMPIFSQRQLDVEVDVYDGETVVLGGVVDSTSETIVDKIPILGDLPLVGRFFQSHAENISRKSLIIFVTARLVNSDGIPLNRGKSPDIPDFNR